jgi:hypothetical protein
MLHALRKVVLVPGVSTRAIFAAATFLAFGWLLAGDLIRPLAVLLLQLYLAF